MSLLTLVQVAKILQISLPTMRRLVDEKQINALQVGRQWRITEAAVTDFIRRSEQRNAS